jgi:hypothetical protein
MESENMDHQAWIEQAEDYERKARAAYDSGDENQGEMYEHQAQASRTAADYATED